VLEMTVRGSTRVLGIFGDPVAHSLSPVMQNEALAKAGIDAVYVPYHVRPENLAAAVSAIRSLDLWGVNVTVPHKEQVGSFLDAVDPAARLIGAVNTIVNRGGVLTGYNTDASGFLRSLAGDLQFNPAGRRVLLLGAGGACRAALVALGQAGATWIGIANRTRSRAEALVGEFGAALRGTAFASFALDPEELSVVVPQIDLLVNTSSLGLKGESFADFPWGDVAPGVLVYDMVYASGGTPFLHAARTRGHRSADGLGMLAAQGEEAFFLWTGQRPPYGVMMARLLAECGQN
jgi:shikimate dehydrogenase